MNTIISLDIETTGLDPNKHDILSIGAVNVKTNDHFYAQIKHRDLCVNLESLKYTDINLAKWEGECLNKVASDFYRWLWNQKQDTKDLLIPLGFNVGSFDMKFLRNKLAIYSCGIFDEYFHYRCIDLNSIIFYNSSNGIGTEDFDSLKKRVTKNAQQSICDNLENYPPYIKDKGLHNALYDCYLNIEVWNYLKSMPINYDTLATYNYNFNFGEDNAQSR